MKKLILFLTIIISVSMMSACSSIDLPVKAKEAFHPSSDLVITDLSKSLKGATTAEPLLLSSATKKVTTTSKLKAKATVTPKAKVKAKATPTPKPKKKVKATPTPKPKTKAKVTPTPKPTPKITTVPKQEDEEEDEEDSDKEDEKKSTDLSQITPPAKRANDTYETYAQRVLDLIIDKDMSKVEKIKTVHDYMVLNTAYDIDNLKADTLPDSSFNEEGGLFIRKAVCQGYSYTFQVYMKLLGIDSKVIYGTSLKDGVSHSWNLVSINDKWYHIDVTWDDPLPDKPENLRYNYFLMTDSIMAADHAWVKSKYPTCTSEKYVYYIYEDNIIDSVKNYEKEFIKRYLAGERTITLLYPENREPSLDFLINYDYLCTIKKKDGKTYYTVNYGIYPSWRLGKYTVFTVVMKDK